MVRPTLEYAASAWDPYRAEDINSLDKVQRRGARYGPGHIELRVLIASESRLKNVTREADALNMIQSHSQIHQI